jgi:hypothetical protein
MPSLTDIYNITPDITQLASGADDLTGTSQVENSLQLPTDYLQDNHDALLSAAKQRIGRMSPIYAQKNQIAPPQPQQNFQESPVPPVHPNGQVNPDFITQLMKNHESKGSYTVKNPDPNSTASGAYQYTDATWNGYGGYTKAMLAPPAVQDQKFREDIANRILHYNGNPFKVIAAHYQPMRADHPETWNEPVKGNRGKQSQSVASYVAQTVHGTPLEQAFQTYMRNPQ